MLAPLSGNARQSTRTIARQVNKARLPPAKRQGTDVCIRYLTSKEPFLRYERALAVGWPIATGVIEGACRHLIADRLDITGARWGLAGAEVLLKLRALTSNGDLAAYWRYHVVAEHRRLYPSSEETYVLTA